MKEKKKAKENKREKRIEKRNNWNNPHTVEKA